MKTNEQIKEAQGIIKNLQDYVELAKVEKKLKLEENIEMIKDRIEGIVAVVVNDVSEL